jgi:hypothetical protein
VNHRKRVSHPSIVEQYEDIWRSATKPSLAPIHSFYSISFSIIHRLWETLNDVQQSRVTCSLFSDPRFLNIVKGWDDVRQTRTLPQRTRPEISTSQKHWDIKYNEKNQVENKGEREQGRKPVCLTFSLWHSLNHPSSSRHPHRSKSCNWPELEASLIAVLPFNAIDFLLFDPVNRSKATRWLLTVLYSCIVVM